MDHPSLRTWYEEELDNTVGHPIKKWHIWHEAGDYLIVLKERPRRYFLATAFHVTGQRNYDYYDQKYRAFKIKKGTGL